MSRALSADPKKRPRKKPKPLVPGEPNRIDPKAPPIEGRELVDRVLSTLATGLDSPQDLASLIQALAFAHGCCVLRLAVIPCSPADFDALAAISKAIWDDGVAAMGESLMRDAQIKAGRAA